MSELHWDLYKISDIIREGSTPKSMKTDNIPSSGSERGIKAFGGVSILLVTPMDRNGRVCEEDLVSLLKFVSAPCVDGESIAGVTVCSEMGEGLSLSPGDRSQVIRLAKQTLGKEKAVIAAIFALSLRETLEQAEICMRSGADALLVVPVTPFVYSELALKMFESISAATKLPIIAYLNKMFKQSLPPAAVVEAVYEIPGIIGIKDSTADASFIDQLIQRRPAGKLVIQTVSALALASVSAGADGLMIGSSNILPQSALEVWVFGRKSDLASQIKAKNAQDRLDKAVLLYQIASAPGARSKYWVVVKEALAQMGIIREEAKHRSSLDESLSFEEQRKISQQLLELVGRERVVRGLVSET